MRTSALPLLLLALAPTLRAQWDVPVRVQLTGDAPADRHITGLADPVAADAAMSAGAVRDNVVSTTAVTGDLDLQGTLFPAPAAYTTGMHVVVLPAAANLPAATLNLNGLGPVPIVRPGGAPVDSADMRPDIPAKLLYDGSAFQLLNTAYHACPPGYVASSRRLCIEAAPRDSTTFYIGARTCMEEGARLCTMSEWTHACRTIPGFMALVDAVEWVDNAANGIPNAKYVGSRHTGQENTTDFACEYGYYAHHGDLIKYRCCITR